MNLFCVIDNCYHCDNYTCSLGFDDSDISSWNCEYYALKVRCPGGLVFRFGEYKEDTCRECMNKCESTGCPRHKGLPPDEYID